MGEQAWLGGSENTSWRRRTWKQQKELRNCPAKAHAFFFEIVHLPSFSFRARFQTECPNLRALIPGAASASPQPPACLALLLSTPVA